MNTLRIILSRQRGHALLGVCLVLAGLLAAGLLLYSVSTAAEAKKPTAGGGKLITNMYYDTPVKEALMDIATQAGVTIVPDASVQGLVTAELNDVPLDKALRIVLSGGNFVHKNMGDFILVGSADPASPSFLKLSNSETLKFNYAKPSDVVKMLYEPLRKYVTANDETHTINIVAPPTLMDQIKSALRNTDRAPDQIMLEARVAVMETQDLLNLGVQWNFPTVLAGTFTDDTVKGTWPWGIQIGYTPGREFTNSLLMTLNLLEQNDDATILSNSQVMAQNAKEAEIKVATEEYFEILLSGVFTQSDLKVIEVGTILKIIPIIAENGDITLTMRAEVSDVASRGENNLPVVTRRVATSTVRVQDGGTAVVGGLIDNRASLTSSGVPGLSRVPVLGYLFGRDLSSKIQRQVAIFVTPRIVSDTKKAPAPRIGSPQSLAGKKYIPVGEEFKEELKLSLSRLDAR